jgi:hypothetical protein
VGGADVKLVIMKRGGQRGDVAVNVDRVTYVASTPGPFTDIYFGDYHVTVEGTFQQVCARLSAQTSAAPPPVEGSPPRNWFQHRG